MKITQSEHNCYEKTVFGKKNKYCLTCGKHCYETHTKAQTEMEHQKSHSYHKKVCNGVYKCKFCGYWHLTSHMGLLKDERTKKLRHKAKKMRYHESDWMD